MGSSRLAGLLARPLSVLVLLGVTLGPLTACDQQGTELSGQLVLVERTIKPLNILSVYPNEGSMNGGTLVALAGEGFETDMEVKFGDAVATQLRVGGDELAVVLTPPGTGTVDVVVTRFSDGQTATVNGAFTYVDRPDDLLVMEVLPGSGPLGGGNLATINGNGFEEGADVYFGANQATGVRLLGANNLSVVVPEGVQPDNIDVRVVLDSGASHTLENGYIYLPTGPIAKLAVLNVIPSEGPFVGGNTVAIRGDGFVDGAVVYFNGAPATNVQVLGVSALTCRIPGGTVAGPVDVRVELPGVGEAAGDAATLMDGYIYNAGEPGLLVTKTIPSRGPQVGGNVVAIEGTGFRDGIDVYFGGAPATEVQVLGGTALTAIAPASSIVGTVDVRVELAALDGQVAGDAYTRDDAYEYLLTGIVGTGDFTVSSLFPNEDKEAGGTLVLITGVGFDPAMTVKFGDTQSPLVQVVSANAATLVAPPGIKGLVDVTLTNPDGAAVTLPNGFRYTADEALDLTDPPALGALVPSRGPLGGGTMIQLIGDNFSPDLQVFFGDAPAAELDILSTTRASVVSPAGQAGSVDVRVVNPDGKEDTLANAFTFADPADGGITVSGTWPSTGPTTGGTRAIIGGDNLSGDSVVWFGMRPATSVHFDADGRLVAVVPAGVVGTVNITVVRSDGAWSRADDAFAYYDAAALPSAPPVVGSVFPSVGNTAGGEAVSALGSGFAAGAKVFFGMDEVMVDDEVSANQRIVITAPHAAGTVGVTVVNPDGLTATAMDAFVFFSPPPLIIGVDPAVASASGGSEVTVSGKNFADSVVLHLGAQVITTFNSQSRTEISFFAPAHEPATLDVRVINPDGQQDLAQDAFVYLSDDQFAAPLVTSVEPPLGLATGGYLALIKGSNFAPGATVTFGGVPASEVDTISPELITLIVPAGAVGATVDITVSNSAQNAGTLAQAFSYTAAPVGPIGIRSVSPGMGSMNGGTVITISGEGFEPGSRVLVGGEESPAVDVISSTVIAAVTPAGDPGLVDIRVERQDMTAATAFKAFAYFDPATFGNGPQVIAVDPVLGPMGGNTAVMISGQRFAGPVQVFFGAHAATATRVLDSGRIVARTPLVATGGTVAVSVVNVDSLVGVLPGAFSFYDATGATGPSVYTVLPFEGSVFGGEEVTVVGDDLSPGARVYFCDRPAQVTGVTGQTQLKVRTPAGEVGPCTVTVVNPDGLTADRTEAFSFVSPTPTVSDVVPSVGPIDGGIDVVVRGQNFVPGATVRFGNAVSPKVTVASSTTLTANLPAGSLGAVEVFVINPGAAEGSAVDAFTYVDGVSGIPPLITQIVPNTGPLSGGTPVQILGTGFDPDALLLFDQAIITGRVFISANEIRFASPATGASGSVPITILNPDGLGATVASGFTYANPTSPPPVITSIVPSAGREAGGTTVTITGSGFDAGGVWSLGGKPLNNVATVTGSLVTAKTPPGVPGKVSLIYVAPDGQVATRIDAFEYLAAPVLTAVTPGLGNVAGGTEVTLIGDHFEPGMKVFFGSAVGQLLSVQSEATALARVPSAQLPGAVDVTVRNLDGQESVLLAGFEYLASPDVTSVWPPTGPGPGGTLVFIEGTGFHGGSRVFFGPNESADVHFSSGGVLLAFAPAGTVGVADVRVVNPDDYEDTQSEGFEYKDPATLLSAPFIGEVFPARGPTEGGTRVSLDGANFNPLARVVLLPHPANVEYASNQRFIVTAPAHDPGAAKVWLVNPDGQTIRALEDFTYLDASLLGDKPVIGSVDPSRGPTAGATTVGLIGQGFQENARVRFGALDGVGVSQSNQQLEVLTPQSDKGAAEIWVINPDGTQALAPEVFLFLPPPTILALDPSRSPADGGVAVTISGQNLFTSPEGDLPDVLFCSDYAAGDDCVPADPQFTQVNSAGTQLTVLAPPHVPVLADVAVLAPDGQVGVAESSFTYSALPSISDVQPDSGPTVGGTGITISGANFQQGVTVLLGGEFCEQVIVVSAGSIDCTTPAGAAGPVDVEVINIDGGGTTEGDGFTYVPPPQVAGVVPNVGPEEGGVTITITGFHFATGLTKPQVFIGSTEVDEAQVVVNGSTSIQITSVPAGRGSNDLKVINPDGQQGLILDGFTYIPPLAPPLISHLIPPTGSTLGGDTFKIIGNAFLDGVRVFFETGDLSWEATDVDVRNNGTLIVGRTPAGSAGPVAVRVVNTDGQAHSKDDVFEFIPPATEADLAFLSIEPSRSILQGGGQVTISGQGFKNGMQIRFIGVGANQAFATEVVRLGPTLVTATIPAAPGGEAGVVTVRLVNPPVDGAPEVLDGVDAFEFVDGPVYERHPGDRLANEPHADRGTIIFDANADGLNDVLVFTDQVDRLRINGYQGRKGHFRDEEFAPDTGNSATSFAVAADFDEDGDVDIVRSSNDRGYLQFCENTGGGEFPSCVTMVSINCTMNRFVAEDFNCDGHLDIFMPFASKSASCKNRMLMGTGHGRFIEAPAGVMPGILETTRGAATADVDLDGDMDLLLANDDADQNRLYLNNCANLQDTGACAQQIPGFDNANYNGSGYAFSNYTKNWTDSRDRCQVFGYDMVKIDDADEDAFVRGRHNSNMWIGLYDPQVEGEVDDNVFVWADGEAPTYTNWAANEPNTPSYNCSMYQYSGTETSRRWYDYPCSSGFNFTCESALPSCDAPWQFADAQYGPLNLGKTFPVTGSNSKDAMFLDVNGDDLPDAIIANWGQQTNVYLNVGGRFAGDDFFRWPQNEENPFIVRLLSADIDEDGDLDIIAQAKDFEVRVYANDLAQGGVGSLVNETPVRWPNGDGFDSRTDVNGIAIGDLDDDRLPDVYLVGRTYTDRLVMNAGYEEGMPWIEASRIPKGEFRFNTFRSVPERLQNTHTVKLGDIDGDGVPDLVRAGYQERLTIHLNDGAGKFIEVTDIVLPQDYWFWGSEPQSLNLVDIDDDGDLDINYIGYAYQSTCTGQDTTCRGRVQLINDGFGHFTDVTETNITQGLLYFGGPTLYYDFDNDGDIDWFEAGTSSSYLYPFVNGGDVWNVGGAYAFYTPELMKDPNTNTTWDTRYTHHMVVVDLDGDEWLDMYVGRSGQNRVLRNMGGEYFQDLTVQYSNTTSDTTQMVLPADYDQDGDEDLVIINNGFNRYLFRQENDYANLTASAFPNPVSKNSQAGASGDLDLDPAGFIDFVVANHNQQNRLYLNLGGTEFLDLTQNMPWDASYSNDVLLFDIDGDGDLDMYVANQGQDRVYVNTIIP